MPGSDRGLLPSAALPLLPPFGQASPHRVSNRATDTPRGQSPAPPERGRGRSRSAPFAALRRLRRCASSGGAKKARAILARLRLKPQGFASLIAHQPGSRLVRCILLSRFEPQGFDQAGGELVERVDNPVGVREVFPRIGGCEADAGAACRLGGDDAPV